MNHYLYNQSIIDKLSELVKKYPELRFGQILWNCGILEWKDIENYIIKDPYIDDSEEIWNKMCNNKFCFPEK